MNGNIEKKLNQFRKMLLYILPKNKIPTSVYEMGIQVEIWP